MHNLVPDFTIKPNGFNGLVKRLNDRLIYPDASLLNL
jgi:hypothetical protein